MTSDRRILYLNPRDLKPSRNNVRSDPGDLAGLAETIREHGVLQPLGVAPEADGYRVIYGNRRRDAAIVVGLDRVPCMVIDALGGDGGVVEQCLENLQRLDLNDMDKSRAFEHLLDRLTEQGMAQGQALDGMARTLGLSARQIQRYLRLRQLAPEVQRLIAEGELGVTHAQHLAEIEPDARQEEVALLVVEESLSAAELARLCAALGHNPNIAPRLALEALRRGERIAVVEARPREGLPSLSAGPTSEEAGVAPWETDLKDDEEEDAEGDTAEGVPDPRRAMPPQGRGDSSYDDFSAMDTSTRDGNRVHKIHSLDAFMDELQRMTRCVQDGDFQRLMEGDEAGAVKVGLAARQLRFLCDAISALAS
ncbi:MAG: ParB/RepB/Spo0J family partition protein [Anaerolineae bacterium]